MKVLLWKIGALGDVVMTTPLVRQLRARLPHARIEYLVGRSSRVVLEGNPHLDAVLDFDEDILFGARVRRIGELVALLRGYDLVFVLDKHWIFGWLAWLARVPRRVGFRRRAFEGWPHTRCVPYGAVRSEIDCYLDLAEAAGLPVDRGDLAAELPPGDAFDWPKPYVVAINSGGRNVGEDSSVRRMPDALFAELVATLARRTPVVFLGSPDERAGYEALAEAQGAANLCGRTTLRQAWSVMAGAEAVYTTDTGLMHMAGAVNRNVLAVFGPTHPLRKCPPGARWVWSDEARYEPRYELFGAVPKGRYFEDVRLADLLAQDPLGATPTPDAGAQPEVSVVIATRNSEATLEACLQSVARQTLAVEVVVVDGVSTDRTLQILRSHAGRIRWTSEPDRGVYDALNKGVRLARGKYVYILGSNDRLIAPDALERLLAGGQGAQVIYGDVVVEDTQGGLRPAGALPLASFRYGMPFSHQAVLVRRDLLQQHPFSDSLASDYRHLYTLYVRGARFHHVAGPVAIYALGGLSSRHAAASTWDRWRINLALRGWRALDVLPFYLAQVAVCWLKPRVLRTLRLRAG